MVARPTWGSSLWISPAVKWRSRAATLPTTARRGPVDRKPRSSTTCMNWSALENPVLRLESFDTMSLKPMVV